LANETQLLVLVIWMFVFGISYSAIVSYVSSLSEELSFIFQNKIVKGVLTAILIIFLVFNIPNMLIFITNILPILAIILLLTVIALVVAALNIVIIPQIQASVASSVINKRNREFDEEMETKIQAIEM
jgi:hypothetical protein